MLNEFLGIRKRKNKKERSTGLITPFIPWTQPLSSLPFSCVGLARHRTRKDNSSLAHLAHSLFLPLPLVGTRAPHLSSIVYLLPINVNTTSRCSPQPRCHHCAASEWICLGMLSRSFLAPPAPRCSSLPITVAPTTCGGMTSLYPYHHGQALSFLCRAWISSHCGEPP